MADRQPAQEVVRIAKCINNSLELANAIHRTLQI